MNVEIDHPALRELDQRSSDGFEVTLLWSERTGELFICVEEASAGSGFHFAVNRTDALDAFRHPYAYAPARVPQIVPPRAARLAS